MFISSFLNHLHNKYHQHSTLYQFTEKGFHDSHLPLLKLARGLRHCTQDQHLRVLKGIVSAKFWANRPKLCGNCAFQQNFHNRELVEITAFYVV